MDDDMVEVTCRDLVTGESESKSIKDGQYLVVCAGRRFVASEQLHANGTVVLTLKLELGGA